MSNETEKRTNIYLYRKDDYESEKERIKNWDTSDRNKEIIFDYYTSMLAKGTTSKRIYKIGGQLRKICNILAKDIDKVDKKDLERLIVEVNQNITIADATKSDYRRIIKAFYKYYKKEDKRLKSENKEILSEALDFYEYASEIKRGSKRKKIDYSNIITPSDCQTIIEKGCSKIVEKAIVSVLHESGFRIGEFLGIRIKDIIFKENYAMIKVDGKTGERRVPIVQSIPFLIQWLERHPEKDNPNALVWLVIDNREKRPFHWIGIIRMLRRVTANAGISKKCNPHWFRHSRATLLVEEGYQEEIIRNIMGWTAGSDEIKTYVHIGAKQVENAFKLSNGLEKEEEHKPKFKKCVCDTINDSSARYCLKCGKALSIAVISQEQDYMTKAFDLFSKLLSDPKLQKEFEEFKKTKT